MSQVALIAKIPAAPGKRAELVEALRGLLVAVDDEPGCLRYILHEDANEPDLVWFYELYADEEALGAHGKGDAFRAAAKQLGPFMGGAPEITKVIPVGGKGA